MISVAITDDHPLILNGISGIIENEAGMSLFGTFLTAADLAEGLSDKQPEVLLLDINLPDASGLDLCKTYSKQYPSMNIIALTTFSQALIVKGMIQNGAMGYLLKNAPAEELILSIKKVHSGEQYLQNEVKEVLLSAALGETKKTSFIPKLTRREKEVLALIVDQLTTAEIAEKLFVSPKTVESHRLHLIQKLGVRNTAGLVKEALLKGLLED